MITDRQRLKICSPVDHIPAFLVQIKNYKFWVPGNRKEKHILSCWA